MVSAEYIGGRTHKNHLPEKPGSKKRKEAEALHKTFAGGSGLLQTFTHDPGTATRISSTPLLRDPFERARTEARPSSIPGAGEGLFAVRALAAGEIACFYSGIRIAHAVVNGRGWEENDNTLSVDADTVVDVPPACVPTANYSATLGHKANHSFTPNARYEPFEHPRFGSIKCVRATQRVAKGAEVTCHYDYNEIGADGELVRLRPPTHTHSLSHQFLANYPLGPPILLQPVTRPGWGTWASLISPPAPAGGAAMVSPALEGAEAPQGRAMTRGRSARSAGGDGAASKQDRRAARIAFVAVCIWVIIQVWE